jgi:hypothetical protein
VTFFFLNGAWERKAGLPVTRYTSGITSHRAKEDNHDGRFRLRLLLKTAACSRADSNRRLLNGQIAYEAEYRRAAGDLSLRLCQPPCGKPVGFRFGWSETFASLASRNVLRRMTRQGKAVPHGRAKPTNPLSLPLPVLILCRLRTYDSSASRNLF